MSSKKDPDVPKKPGSDAKSSGAKTPFSRRGFLSGLGIGSGALGTGILTTGLAEPASAAAGVGPGAVPVTLKINGKDQSLTIEPRSEEHTSELQSHHDLVCRLLLEKKKNTNK